MSCNVTSCFLILLFNWIEFAKVRWSFVHIFYGYGFAFHIFFFVYSFSFWYFFIVKSLLMFDLSTSVEFPFQVSPQRKSQDNLKSTLSFLFAKHVLQIVSYIYQQLKVDVNLKQKYGNYYSKEWLWISIK